MRGGHRGPALRGAALTTGHGRLFLLVCAAQPLRSLRLGLELARARGFETWVGASDSARSWIEPGLVEDVTGREVLGTGSPLPGGDLVVAVAPATFNTVNKLALGIADSFVTAVAAEAVGAGRPVVVAPSMNTALMAHPVIAESRRRLASYGVLVQWPDLGNEHTEDTTAWWTTVVTACAEAHGRMT